MKTLFKVFVFLLSLSMFSCATIFTGTKDTIYFDTKPQGATVIIDGIDICKTPCSTDVRRSLSDKMVEFKLDGYETRIVTLDKSFNVISILNFFGLFGWAIDAITGSVMKYDRKSYNIELERVLSNVEPYIIDVNTEEKVLTIYVTE